MTTRNNLTLPLVNLTLHQSPNADPSYNLPLIIILGTLIPLTFFGNSLVCFAFIRIQRLQNATNCFLFNLAISDLAVGLILIPFWISYNVIGFAGISPTFMKLWTILDITCSVASMANLASVSIERWYGIYYPLRHISMSASNALPFICCSWLYGLVTGLLSLVEGDWENIYLVITVLGLCLPFVVMTICYLGIARKIKQKTLSGNPRSGKECKTIRTLILVSIVFLICWLPFIIGSLIINYCTACALYVRKTPALHISLKVLHYSNSCINPLLYALLSPSFKSAYQQLLGGTRRRRIIMNRRRGFSLDRSTTGSQTRKLNLTTSNWKRRTSILQESNHIARDSLNSNRIPV